MLTFLIGAHHRTPFRPWRNNPQNTWQNRPPDLCRDDTAPSFALACC